MMRPVVATGLVVFLVVSPQIAEAQNSIFGTRGLGFPMRPVSVRARALGGGALFDRGSMVNPAAVTAYNRLTVTVSMGTTFRSYEADGTEAGGLSETRFPLAQLGGPIATSPLTFGVGFASFAERSFDLTVADTLTLNGASVPVRDRVTSDGGVVDVRGGVGWRASSRWAFGAAVHVLTGSSRVAATRVFENGDFTNFRESDDVSFSGNGFSVGAVWLPNRIVDLAASARFNTRISNRLSDGSKVTGSLPVTLSAGTSVSLTPVVQFLTSATWRSWSQAGEDFADEGVAAFDTWDWAAGFEIGGPDNNRPGGLPIRLGARYAQLPFSPTDERPHEWNLTLGTGAPFAGNRAAIDLTAERFFRSGAGVSERGWFLTLGLTVSP